MYSVAEFAVTKEYTLPQTAAEWVHELIHAHVYTCVGLIEQLCICNQNNTYLVTCTLDYCINQSTLGTHTCIDVAQDRPEGEGKGRERETEREREKELT